MIRWNNDKFDKFLIDNKTGIIRLDDYKKSSAHIKCKCLKCHHIWQPLASNIIAKHGCPKCSNNIKLTNEIIDTKLIELKKDIIRLQSYVNARQSAQWKCTNCKKKFKTSWDNIINKNKKGCGCKGGIFLFTKKYAQKFIGNRNIKIIGNPLPRTKKTTFKCLVCKNTWKSIIGNVCRKKNPSGCPNCRFKRQRFVGDILRIHFPQNKNKYIKTVDPEFRINLNKKRAFVDFNVSLDYTNFFVEYNGEQHYMPVTFGVLSEDIAKEKYKNQIIRDAKLKEYCEERNISLIIIPYTFTDTQIENTIISLKHTYAKP